VRSLAGCNLAGQQIVAYTFKIEEEADATRACWIVALRETADNYRKELQRRGTQLFEIGAGQGSCPDPSEFLPPPASHDHELRSVINADTSDLRLQNHCQPPVVQHGALGLSLGIDHQAQRTDTKTDTTRELPRSEGAVRV
jgi:hypothetical protein